MCSVALRQVSIFARVISRSPRAEHQVQSSKLLLVSFVSCFGRYYKHGRDLGAFKDRHASA